MIRFSCPSCGAKVAAPEPLAGRNAPCKNCGETIRVPDAPPAGIAAAPRPSPPQVTPIQVKQPRRFVIPALLAGVVAMGLATGGVAYYFRYRPQTPKGIQPVPRSPAVAPALPVANPRPVPTGPTPQALAAETARKEAVRQEEARQAAERLKAMLTERARLDAEIQAAKEETQRAKVAFSLLTDEEKKIALHIAQELADSKCNALSSDVLTEAEKAAIARSPQFAEAFKNSQPCESICFFKNTGTFCFIPMCAEPECFGSRFRPASTRSPPTSALQRTTRT